MIRKIQTVAEVARLWTTRRKIQTVAEVARLWTAQRKIQAVAEVARLWTTRRKIQTVAEVARLWTPRRKIRTVAEVARLWTTRRKIQTVAEVARLWTAQRKIQTVAEVARLWTAQRKIQTVAEVARLWTARRKIRTVAEVARLWTTRRKIRTVAEVARLWTTQRKIQTVAEVARLWTAQRKIQTLASSATTTTSATAYSLVVFLLCSLLAGCSSKPSDVTASLPEPGDDGCFHVYPGDDIQRFLDAAAASSTKSITVHAGTYRPTAPAQALLHFTRQHDGITLRGEGEVILSAANADVADPGAASYPAIVNHVVYFGDGVGGGTTLRGVTLTGAKGFAGTDESLPALEPPSERSEIQTRGMFYYLDGGAIKIFGRSAPLIEDVLVYKNFTRLCGAGVSVEQRGLTDEPAVFRDCLFIDNLCPGTGAAIDLLSGSSAKIENCLFVGNIANTGMDQIAIEFGLTYKPQHGCGALTVFPQSRADVSRCTFTQNWNAVDDAGQGSRYLDCIFWHNDASDGSRPAGPYELDVVAAEVSGCWIGGAINDLRGTIDSAANHLNASNPQFDDAFVPLAESLSQPQQTGYRPVRTPAPQISALQGRSH